MNSLLNPKALLFYVVFLPQFVQPGAVAIARQLSILGGTLTFLAFAFHAMLGMLGGTLQRWLTGHARGLQFQSRGLALVLLSLALRVAFGST